jgi:signal transduction histidine kinase
MAQLDRVRNALMTPELVFGVVLLLVVYGGSLIVGLRASAPLELVHQRQAEFTADASHELRTPLSVIGAEVDLALRRPRTPDEYTAVLHRIGDEGRRLRCIVDDLLWLARADDEGATGDPNQEADVAEIATACAERFRPVAMERRVTLRVEEAGAEAARIHADPSRVDRLVGVLVDNACKYAGADGLVEVRVRELGNRVVLQVDDTGPGIPADQRALVFDRFHRGTDELGGNGLGLAIADSVVRASGGTWSVGASPSGGTRMEVSWRRVGARRAGPPGPVARGDKTAVEAGSDLAAD